MYKTISALTLGLALSLTLNGNMIDFGKSINTIQDGFYKNDKKIVSKGIENLITLSENVKFFKNQEDMLRVMESIEYRDKKRMIKNIRENALKTFDYFNRGDHSQAIHSFSKIQKDCIRCHDYKNPKLKLLYFN